tara:strand:+ start:402 stop:1382 length:981 start_codon:yes stop_codon:yes gene_type:complete
LKKIAVIGTGLSALSLVYHLPALDITFFEKSWRPGGRISTRRYQNYAFDHGAHYLKEDHGMIGLNDFLNKINSTKILKGDFCANIQNQSPIEEKQVIVGQNGMESIPLQFHKYLRYPTHLSTTIEKIENKNQEYCLLANDQEYGPFDFIFCCLPYDQSKFLLEDFIDFSNFVTPNFDSIWTVMIALDKRLGSPFQFGYHLSPEISFLMNQNFKHEFFSDECWVVNMRAEWTNKYYNIENYVLEDYTIDLIKKFFQSDSKPVFKKSHRWKYAYIKKSFEELNKKNYIESIDHRLFALGDWCHGPSIQDAWLAGKKMAKYFSELRIQL